jgi:protease YdgD
MRAVALGFAVALGAFAVSPSGPQAGEESSADPRISASFLPGVGTHDPRGRFDPDKVPWRAVGKLQAVALNLRMLCTGTLVSLSKVLTAAHCVFNPRAQHNFPPESLHFLIGYEGNRYARMPPASNSRPGPAMTPAGRPRREAAIGR